MSVVIGIDLGTTNSCVAIMESGGPAVVPNAEGSRTTPTMVAFTEGGDRLVGHIAKRQAVSNPENTVYSAKRFIGRRYDSDEIRRAAGMIPFRIVEAGNGDAWVEVREKTYSPPEVQAIVLQSLRKTVEDHVGEEVHEAVITVPAYFDDSQRQATKDAGTIAGLNVIRIINEPTAAALAYGMEGGERRKVAVYDLGGGTFDITVLEIGDGVYEVLSTSGDTFLGGDDFDQKVIEFVAGRFRDEHGIDLSLDRMALQRLKESVERAKHELSSAEEANINLPFLTTDTGGPKHMDYLLTRDKLEELVGELVERTIAPCRRALESAGATIDDIADVILVGGQTRMPMVQERVRSFFKREPNRSMNPDEVVALGAAVQGGVLRGNVRNVLLLDVTPLSLGIEVKGGVFSKLIEANTCIPFRRSRVFTTVSDNQTSVVVHVLQGEREMASDNRSLGQFEFIGIPPAPRGMPKIEVAFDIDANGIVNVSARDKGTGREQAIRISASSGLNKEEVDAMKAEAERLAAEDTSRRQHAELRNEAESILYAAERTVEEYGDKVGSGHRTVLRECSRRMREALEKDEKEDITDSLQKLKKATHAVSKIIYGMASSPPEEGHVHGTEEGKIDGLCDK